MKRVLLSAFLCVAAVAAPLFASGSKEDSGKVKTTVLRVAFNQSENHPQYKALKEFGEKFTAETNGAYEFEIHPNALLGDQRATVELVQNGAVQMSLVANAVVENYNKDFGVIGLPYVYDSLDHQKAVFTSGILDDLYATTTDLGFNVVLAFTAGARSIYTDKQITKPADLDGYKIRVMQSETMIETLNSMGAVGTPMGQGEVYTAVQQGVIDGGENNEITYADLKHYEIAPFYTYTQHLMVPDLLIINSEVLNSMSDENRAIFNSLAKETIEREFTLWNEQVQVAKDEAIANGATFNTVDITPFQNNCLPLHEKLVTTDSGKVLYEEVRALAK